MQKKEKEMAKKKTYRIEIKKTATGCGAGKEILDQLRALPEGSTLPVKVVIGKEIHAGQLYVYREEEKWQTNGIGIVKSVVSEGGETLDTADLQLLAEAGNYELFLGSASGSNISGSLTVLLDDAKTVTGAATPESIRKAADEAIEKGFVSREEMDARLAYMAENHVPVNLQAKVISGYRLYNKPAHKPSCLYQDPYLDADLRRKREGKVTSALRDALARNGVICEGDKSVGKNVFLETIAWLLNMPMYLITFSKYMSPSAVFGEKTTDNTAAELLENFDSDILREARRIREKHRDSFMTKLLKTVLNGIYAFIICRLLGKGTADAEAKLEWPDEKYSKKELEILSREAEFEKLKALAATVHIKIDASELYDCLIDGGVIIFNEVNMAESNFLASFTNQLLDGTGFLFIPGRGEVPIHRDFVLFATQNADYEGTMQQNEATMSRFGCLHFPQPESIKRQIIAATASSIRKHGSAASLDAKYFTQCESFYKMCRGAVKNGQLSNSCLNIRGYVRALTNVALDEDGTCTLKQQVEEHVINTCPVDERTQLCDILDGVMTL